MSSASCSFGVRRVNTPGSGTSALRNSVESTSRMPSSSSTRATAPISASVFFLGSENNSFASFQSGRMALKILLCFTCPAITACVTPSCCSNSMVLLSSPRLTQCSRFAIFSSSGEASSFNAITAISIPWLRAPSSTRNGKRPLPAMSPQPFNCALASGMKSAIVVLFHNAAFRAFDEADQFLHVRRISQRFLHLRERLRSVEFRPQQQMIRMLQRLQALRRKFLALQADRVEAVILRLALRHDLRKRRHVLCNHRGRADVRVPAEPAKLVHRAKRTHRHVIFHRHVSRQRRAVHEQRVAADHTIVPDVRIRQKKIAVPQRSFAAAFLRSPADRHVFPENIPVSGNKLHALLAKRIVLRVASDDTERMKHIVLTKFRRSLYDRMRVQHAAVTQFHRFAHYRVRADLDAFAKLRARTQDGLRMNFSRGHFAGSSPLARGSRSTILHISVASTANCPSTVAFPSSLQKSPRQERT